MTITAEQLFAQGGGRLSVAADLALAAYHLSPSEMTGNAINLANSAGEQAFAALTANVQWLTSAELPTLAPAASGNPDFPFDGLNAGVFTHANAAALVGRSSDALFISFRGTNDTAGAGNILFGTPDNNQWSDPAAHYANLSALVTALDAFTADPANGISHVYVSGHSLGGAMAQLYMKSHAGALYDAVTFASIGTDLPGGVNQPDSRQTNLWIENDIARLRFAATHDDLGDDNFANAGLGIFDAGSIHDMRTYTALAHFLDANDVPLTAINDGRAGNIDSLILAVSDFRPADGVFVFGGNNDVLTGTDIAEILIGGAGSDQLSGMGGNDTLIGGIGSDALNGGSGDDHLLGGLQADRLRGGTGADVFEFKSIFDTRRGAGHDTIIDMKHRFDHIDLHLIDAKIGAGDDAFRWIASQAFHGRAGELHIVHRAGHLFAEGDINGNRRPDFQIEVDHVLSLTKGDFIL